MTTPPKLVGVLCVHRWLLTRTPEPREWLFLAGNLRMMSLFWHGITTCHVITNKRVSSTSLRPPPLRLAFAFSAPAQAWVFLPFRSACGFFRLHAYVMFLSPLALFLPKLTSTTTTTRRLRVSPLPAFFSSPDCGLRRDRSCFGPATPAS